MQRCHVKEATSLHEKASSIRDELKEQLKAALSDKLQADQALEKLQVCFHTWQHQTNAELTMHVPLGIAYKQGSSTAQRKWRSKAVS